MPKPNEDWKLKDMKVYVKNHKLNKGQVPLSLNKTQMIKRLKLANHWDHNYSKRKKLRAGKSV
jgi:hypothetical protein